MERNKVLESYIKNGRTKEEFYEKYKDRFLSTFVYDKDGTLIKEGYFDRDTIVRKK